MFRYLSIDDDVQDEDTEYLEYLAQQAANQSNENTDADDDEEDEIAEEILFESPLDEIDPYVCFEQVFRGKSGTSAFLSVLQILITNPSHFFFYLDMQQNNPEFYAHLTKDLNADEQNNIMSVLTVAEQNRNDLSTV